MNVEEESCEGLNMSCDLFDDNDEDFIFSTHQEKQSMANSPETAKLSSSSSSDSVETTRSSYAVKEENSIQVNIQSEVEEKPSIFGAPEECDDVGPDYTPHKPKRHKAADFAQSSNSSLSHMSQGNSSSIVEINTAVSKENVYVIKQQRHSHRQNISTGSSVDEESSSDNLKNTDQLETDTKNKGLASEFSCPFCCVTESCVLLLEHHIFTAHPDMSDLEESTYSSNREKVNSASAFLYVCPFCDMDLETQPALTSHLNTAHLEEENLEDTGAAAGSFSCPLCAASFISAEEMANHVKSHESDSTYYGISGNLPEPGVPHFVTSQDFVCPMCGKVMDDPDLLTSHVETHFSSQHCPGEDEIQAVNKENIPVKQINNAHIGSAKLKADVQKPSTSYSSSLQGPNSSFALTAEDVRKYRRQYEQSLEKEVLRGRMSVADYHEQRAGMQGRDWRGVDDGHSRVDGLIEQLARLYRQQARPGQKAYLCSPTSYFCGSYGDRGWGCGYRNFQMMLSCLSNQSQYADKIFKDSRPLIPSVPKVQQMIESAWSKGFDPDGCHQLSGQLVNTQKWIGATEIVATLSSLGVRCRLADFHAPSAPDGSHPRLLGWVTDYFTSRQNQQFTPPLYLQHQGHSRTIVGVEIDRGTTRLLLFDPGSKKDHIATLASSGLNWKSMRTFRRTQLAFKSKQYQIVAVDGILTQREYEDSKIIKSERIS